MKTNRNQTTAKRNQKETVKQDSPTVAAGMETNKPVDMDQEIMLEIQRIENSRYDQLRTEAQAMFAGWSEADMFKHLERTCIILSEMMRTCGTLLIETAYMQEREPSFCMALDASTCCFDAQLQAMAKFAFHAHNSLSPDTQADEPFKLPDSLAKLFEQGMPVAMGARTARA